MKEITCHANVEESFFVGMVSGIFVQARKAICKSLVRGTDVIQVNDVVLIEDVMRRYR